MTAIYKLPESISQQHRFRSNPVNARKIRAVIPTYKDWDGLRVTLDSLLNLKTPPKQITVANDNPDSFVPDWLKEYPVELFDYPGNAGPAEARNRAFGFTPAMRGLAMAWSLCAAMKNRGNIPSYWRQGDVAELSYDENHPDPKVFGWNSDVEWVYFTDCGCSHSPDLFLEFEKAWKDCGDCCVAISGPITGSGEGTINDYMTHQGVLNPPIECDLHGVHIPQAIITANALVAALPFAFLGGFNTEFPEAAGEDLDMGLRLRKIGIIAWAAEAKAAHRFDENDSDFYKRFRRYGRGNRRLELMHNLPCLRARPFQPDQIHKPEHHRLAKLACEAMQAGYDEAVKEGDRGVLSLVD
jgi:GT2 family glycosyltransferase